MAIFHHLFSGIYRGGHTCAMATAAYRSGSTLKLRTNLTDSGKLEDIVFDYSTKKGIGFSHILTLSDTPKWIRNREFLWQFVEDVVTDVEGVLACESIFALPEELCLKDNINLVLEYAEKFLLPIYSLVDINIHNDHPNNPHVHLMSPLIIFNSDANISDTSCVNRINYSQIIECELQNIENGFVEVANKHLLLNGYSQSIISNRPKGIPRYHQLRPWL